jgi:hypothetical protein
VFVPVARNPSPMDTVAGRESESREGRNPVRMSTEISKILRNFPSKASVCGTYLMMCDLTISKTQSLGTRE